MPSDTFDAARLFAALDAIRNASPWHASRIHGEDHWRRVATHGLDAAERTPGADRVVALLFGLFHDSQRLNDGRDPDHGRRGASLARALNAEVLRLDSGRLEALVTACDGHTAGRTSANPTIGACWDSDRLDLVRLDYRLDRRKMSTAYGRSPEAEEQARSLLGRTPRWDDVFGRVGE